MPATSVPGPLPPPPVPPVYADVPSLNLSSDNVSLIITIFFLLSLYDCCSYHVEK